MAGYRSRSTWSSSMAVAALIAVVGLLGVANAQSTKVFTLKSIQWPLTKPEETRFLSVCIAATSGLDKIKQGYPQLAINGVTMSLIPLEKKTDISACYFMCSCNLWKNIRKLANDEQASLVNKTATELTATFDFTTEPTGLNAIIGLLDGKTAAVKKGKDVEFSVEAAEISMIMAEGATKCDKAEGIAATHAVYHTDGSDIPTCDTVEDVKKGKQVGVALFREPATLTYTELQAAKDKKTSAVKTKCSGASAVAVTTQLAMAFAALVAVVHSFEL